MRIIAGDRRGKKLTAREGADTRPTLDRVKARMFDSIQFEIADKIVLDLFAGSGQLGLEALSRGARFCYFNDSAPDAVRIIKKNISACGYEKKCLGNLQFVYGLCYNVKKQGYFFGLSRSALS